MQSLDEVVHVLLTDLHHAGLEAIMPSSCLDLLGSQLKARPEPVLDYGSRLFRARHTNNKIRRNAFGHDDERPCLVPGPPAVFTVDVDEEGCELSQSHGLREKPLVRFAATDECVSKVLEQSQAPLFHHRNSLLNHSSLKRHAQRESLLQEGRALSRQSIVSSVEAVYPPLFVFLHAS